ncbi:MAG: undecaprenyl-phosphate glucose phosphotransferase, partial [Hyphomicrobiales bacterium]|nr:undecaprenyl-phosphate glucose phosphotransferase [Hyphomicrobiales bacterium]
MLIDTREAIRGEIKAKTEQAAKSGDELRRRERTRQLTPEALEIVREQVGKPVSRLVLTGLVRLGDFVLTALVGAAVYFSYVVAPSGMPWLHGLALVVIPAMAVIALQALNAYRVNQFRNIARQSIRIGAGWTAVFLAAFAIAFFAKAGAEFSRVWLGGWYFGGLTALVLSRVVLHGLVRKWTAEGRLQQRAAIIGGGEAAAELIQQIEASD